MSKWKRVALAVRIAAILVLAGVLGFMFYQTYDFYRGRLGNSPVGVTQDYFEALGEGNYARVYALTNPASLTDLYGQRATQSEVYDALRRVTGSPPKQFSSITVVRLAYRGDTYFMQATLTSPNGATSRMVVELTRVAGVWLVTMPFGLAP